MSKYPKYDFDLPTREELAHIPHANNWWYSEQEVSQLIEGNITAQATRLQPQSIQMWGRDYRLMVSENGH